MIKFFDIKGCTPKLSCMLDQGQVFSFVRGLRGTFINVSCAKFMPQMQSSSKNIDFRGPYVARRPYVAPHPCSRCKKHKILQLLNIKHEYKLRVVMINK